VEVNLLELDLEQQLPLLVEAPMTLVHAMLSSPLIDW